MFYIYLYYFTFIYIILHLFIDILYLSMVTVQTAMRIYGHTISNRNFVSKYQRTGIQLKSMFFVAEKSPSSWESK